MAANTDKAGGLISKFSGGLAGLFEGAGPAGPQAALAAAGTAIATFAIGGIKAYEDLGQSVLQFQRTSGATAEQASALIAALDDMGISADTGATAMFQLGKRLQTNSATLAKYGVEAVRSADGNTDLSATLLKVADAYVATRDPAQRAALVNAAFGKSGQALIPILEKGSKGIRDMYANAARTGQIMSPEDVQRSEDFRLAIDDLHDSFKQFALAAGETLLPIATDFVNLTTKGLEFVDKVLNAKIGGESWVHQLGIVLNPLKNTQIQAGYTAKDFEGLTRSVDASGKVTWSIVKPTEAAADATGGLGDASQGAAGSIDEQNGALAALQNTLLATSNAQRAYDQATRQVDKAERGLADARSDLNKLQREGAVDEEKVADAIRSHEDAVRSLHHAQREQADAQKDYNEALAAFQQFGGDTNADKLADAKDNLADANDSVASAQDREKDSAAQLAKARAGDPGFNEKLATAKQRVTDAETGLKDAQYGSADAALKLTTQLQTQARTIGDNAEAVKSLRTEWDTLLRQHPELLAVLGKPLDTLGPAGPTPGPGYGLRGFETATAGTAAPTPAATQNITVNVTSPQNADPTTLARNLAWNLSGGTSKPGLN